MKLMNFRRLDPSYQGKGLDAGSKEDEVVWNLYSDKPDSLRDVSAAILSLAQDGELIATEGGSTSSDMTEAEEGRILTRLHAVRERNVEFVRRKKQIFLNEHGKIFCEACDFDFEKTYGPHGSGFIECHHTRPISELRAGEKTRVLDLVLLCSNCHRMIHRSRPWLSLDDLRNKLKR